MTVGELKECMEDVPDDLPVCLLYGGGWVEANLAYEDVVWNETTPPGQEEEVFCIEFEKKGGYMPVDEERPQGVVKYEPAAHGEEPANPVVKNAPGRVEK